MARKTIFDFSGGQVSPRYKSRVDSPIYHRSCKSLINFRVWPTGGIERIPGTIRVAETVSNNSTRLFSFVTKDKLSYVLAITAEGASTKSKSKVYRAGTAEVAVVSDSDNTSSGGLVPGETEGSLADTPTTTLGSDATVESLPTAFTAAQLKEIQYVQDADVLRLVHPSHKSQKLTRSSDTAWVWANSTPSASASDHFQGLNFTDGAGSPSAVYSSANATPRVMTFYQQRLVIGGVNTHRNELQGSDLPHATDPQQGIEKMDSASDGSGGWSYTQQGTGIEWVAGWTSLLTGTAEGEYSWGDEPIGALAANVPNIKQVSGHGSYNKQPLFAGGRLLFIQRGGLVIREMLFNADQKTYNARNLSILADNILGTLPMVDWAYQKSPIPAIWVVRGDGKLAVMTYDIENDLYSWNLVDVGGIVESIAVVSAGTEDQVWIVVQRTIAGSVTRHIEYFDTFNRADKTVPYYVFSGNKVSGQSDATIASIATTGSSAYTITCNVPVDHGLVNDQIVRITGLKKDDGSLHEMCTTDTGAGRGVYLVGESASTSFKLEKVGTTDGTKIKGITGSTAWTTDLTAATGTVTVVVNEVTGLAHLNGETVTCTGDGSELPQVTVGSGKASLGGYYKKATAGVGVDSDCIPLGIDSVDDFGFNRTVKRVLVRVMDTNSLQVGPDTDNLDDITFKTTTDTMDEAPPLMEDIIEKSVIQKVTNTGSIVLRAKKESGLACSVIGLVAEYEG